MWVVVQVALGGGIGAVARFGIGSMFAASAGATFPWGTFLVNVTGTFLIGFLWVILANHNEYHRVSPFLVNGILGGFTTFSAFSLDSVLLWQKGHEAVAVLYVLATLGCAFVAFAVGFLLARVLFA